jgi:hypothetical protein
LEGLDPENEVVRPRKEEEGTRKWGQVICLRWCCEPLWLVCPARSLSGFDDPPLPNGPKTVDLSLSDVCFALSGRPILRTDGGFPRTG